MTITISTHHIVSLIAASIPLILFAATAFGWAIRWAIRTGLENALLKLESRIASEYVTTRQCTEHRAECPAKTMA